MSNAYLVFQPNIIYFVDSKCSIYLRHLMKNKQAFSSKYYETENLFHKKFEHQCLLRSVYIETVLLLIDPYLLRFCFYYRVSYVNCCLGGRQLTLPPLCDYKPKVLYFVDYCLIIRFCYKIFQNLNYRCVIKHKIFGSMWCLQETTAIFIYICKCQI